MPAMLSPRMTAGWEMGLTRVAEGELDEDEYMGKLNEYISSTVESAKRSNNQAKLSGFYSRVKGYYKGGNNK